MQKITSDIYMLNGWWGAGLLSANIYLLAGNRLTIVDTGYKGRVSGICREIIRLGYALTDVENIILTHHHVDHTGSLFKLKQLTGASVIAHTDESPYIEGELPHFCPQVAAKKQFVKYFLGTYPLPVDIRVNDGDTLPILGGVRVIHTPGHTQGSISLLIQHSGVIIVGDLLANTLGLSLPSKAFTVDMKQDTDSICKITGVDFNIICFGHGYPIIKDAHEKVNDFAKRLKKHGV
jgi:glyoxylase-like metal-dependent hydrolase (beta-lactamase superfamily II)